MEAESIRRNLRATRARPPAKANQDPERRAIYGASLEQFEQLLDASRAVGAAARPLTLFYALSQAGRAIVAAKGDRPSFDGHGLSEDRGLPLPDDFLHRRIKRSPSKRKDDAFTAVSNAIGSPSLLDSVELGAVWAALPETYKVPEGSWLPEWRAPLPLLEQPARQGGDETVTVQAWSMSGNPHLDEVSTLRGRYPTLPADTKVHPLPRDSTLGPGTWIAALSWSDERSLDVVAPTDELTDWKSRNLLPTLPGHSECLKPLMMWWTLLFGFSVFARYHPAPWMTVLEVERSESAVPIEAVLDTALVVIPRLVYHELLG